MLSHVLEREESHEEYAHGEMLSLLRRLLPALEAIQLLHDNDLCHGDIRNDHLILETGSDRIRWIDFDLKQDFSDFDVWSAGNVLAYVVGKGIRSFHQVLRDPRFPDVIKSSLTPADASAFYEYRIYNLGKLFPYLPREIDAVVKRFTLGSEIYYPAVREIVQDLGNALTRLP
jgi:hypothetical protein